MVNERIFSRIFLFLRILFGIVFVFSAIMKFTDIESFMKALGSFKLLSKSQLSIAGYLVPIVEMLLGSLLLFKIKISMTAQLTTFMLAMFTAILVAKLFEGEEISCGCFGSLTTDKIDIVTVIRNVILIIWGVSISVFYDVKNSVKKRDKTKSIIKTIYVHSKNFLFFLFFFFLAFQTFIFALQNKELKKRLYLLMSDKEILQTGEIVKPFTVFNNLGDEITLDYSDDNDAKTLMFLFSVNCEPCKMNLPNWFSLVEKVKNEKLRIIGIALDSLENVNKYVFENKINFETYAAPQIEFKISYKGFITPQTILIDPVGKVINIWAGQLNRIKLKKLMQRL